MNPLIKVCLLVSIKFCWFAPKSRNHKKQNTSLSVNNINLKIINGTDIGKVKYVKGSII